MKNRAKLLLLGVIAAVMLLGSSLALASQAPGDEAAASADRPAVHGGLGRSFKN